MDFHENEASLGYISKKTLSLKKEKKNQKYTIEKKQNTYNQKNIFFQVLQIKIIFCWDLRLTTKSHKKFKLYNISENVFKTQTFNDKIKLLIGLISFSSCTFIPLDIL